MKSINGSGLKRIALINDLSCFGKCSLSVALPIVSAYGVEGVALPTVVLSSHTAGFEGFVARDMTEEMRAFAAHWASIGMKFDCIYTGFFGSVEQLDLTMDFIRRFSDENTVVVVDPVLGDNGRLYPCFSPEYVVKMRELAAMADVITPNRTEAQLLQDGMDIEDDYRLLQGLGNRNVIITGIRQGANIGCLARLDGETVYEDRPYKDILLHGTGDVLTSAFCGALLSMGDMKSALKDAVDFCDNCINFTVQRQPAHWFGLSFEDELRRRNSSAK